VKEKQIMLTSRSARLRLYALVLTALVSALAWMPARAKTVVIPPAADITLRS
jgi:hypothetical protein